MSIFSSTEYIMDDINTIIVFQPFAGGVSVKKKKKNLRRK